jgi:pilus assembly protein CpaE
VPARILVVDDDANVQRVLTYALRQEGYEVVPARDGAEALKLWSGDRPSLILLDATVPKIDGYQVAAKIRSEEGRAGHVPIIMLAAETDLEHKIKGLRSGADDFLVKPFHSAELLARIRSLLARFAPRELEKGRAAGGRIIAFYGAKGGVGTTSLAINTAIALHKTTSRGVVLVDANLQFGDHRVFLDLGKDRQGIVEAVSDATPDADTLRRVIVRHETGIALLLAPPAPETAELVTPDAMVAVLRQLEPMFDYVVVDCDRRLDETTLQIFDMADTLFVVMTADLLSLKNTSLVLEMSRNLAYHRDKLQLVLNRSGSTTGVNMRHAEAVLKHRIQYEIPNDHKAASAALNQGTPFVMDNSESLLTKAVFDFARSIERGGTAAQPQQPAAAGVGAASAAKRAEAVVKPG